MADIDFVITWVDGSDPALAQARKYAKNALGSRTKGRYHNNGEIYYLIASIVKYAPFVRRVYIVTDNQEPPLLEEFVKAGICSPDFLRLVSHDVIFDGLDVPRPTFNSQVIEAAIWRIPGLSERFVYCNDDMFLNAPAMEEDFFYNGKPVIRGSMRLPGEWIATALLRRICAFLRGQPAPDSFSHGRAQERGARLAGVSGRFLMSPHTPHPLRRSTAEAFLAEKPELVRSQMQHRFRHSSQYLQVSLSNHLERRKHGVGFKSGRQITYVTPSTTSEQLSRSLTDIRRNIVPFGCVQSLERLSSTVQAEIHSALQAKFSAELPESILTGTATTIFQGA